LSTVYKPIDAEFDDGINKHWVTEWLTEATVGDDESLKAMKDCQVDSD